MFGDNTYPGMGSLPFSSQEQSSDPFNVDMYGRPLPKKNPLAGSVNNNYKLYNSAVGQNAQDYAGLTGGYNKLLSQSSSNPQTQTYNPQQTPNPTSYTPAQINAPNTYSPTPTTFAGMGAPPSLTTKSYNPATTTAASYNPESFKYSQSGDLTSAIANLKGLSETGGYSEGDKANITARGIAPIRAVYGNAQNDLSRQRALTGGYSPNYGAVSSKMAREMADQLSAKTTDVAAVLGQNIAQNKLTIAPTYANATAGQSDLANQIGLANTGAINTANATNSAAVNAANAANMGAINTGNQFNINNANDVNARNAANAMAIAQFNATGQNATNQYNAGLIGKANEFNIGNQMGVNATNANAINEANKLNIQNQMGVNAANTNTNNQGQQFNIQNQQQQGVINNQQSQQALQGLLGAYQATPGMSQLYGGQAIQGANLQNIINQQNKQYGLGLLGATR